MLTIRMAEVHDADSVASVHARSWQVAYRGLVPDEFLDSIDPADWAERFRSRMGAGRSTLIAVDGHTPAGMASFGPDRQGESFAEIYALYVHPAHQGRGIGRALLDAALSMLEPGTVRLWCAALNSAARRFYEHYGFATDGGHGVYDIGGVTLSTVRYIVTVHRADLADGKALSSDNADRSSEGCG